MTLRSWKVSSAAGLYEYLSDGESPSREQAELGDYYTRIRGEAWGSGAARMAFDRGRDKGRTLVVTGISKFTFNALAAGMSPNRTKQLIPTQDGKHVPGFDHQFSPPKSVSLEAAFNEGHRDRILRAHQRATEAAFEAMEHSALVCRISIATPAELGPRLIQHPGLLKARIHQFEQKHGRAPTQEEMHELQLSKQRGSDVRHVPAELVAYATTHWTARPTEETEKRESGPDPQLHTHVFVFNIGYAEGKWRAIDHRGLVHKVALAESVYQATLAHELGTLGYQLDHYTDRQGRRTFELAGTDPAVCDFFSTRHREIAQRIRDFERGHGRDPNVDEMKELVEAFQEAHGRMPGSRERADIVRQFHHGHGRPPTEFEEQQLARQGRLAKSADHAEPNWSSQKTALVRAGLELPQYTCLDHVPIYDTSLEDRAAIVRADLLGPDGLHREDSVFYRHQIEPAIWRASIGRLSPQETTAFIAEFSQSDELVVLREHHNDRTADLFTTKSNLAQERRVIDTVVAQANDVGYAPSDGAVEMAVLSSPRVLDPEQRGAVAWLTRSTRWAGLEGYAGTGKTTCLAVVAEAYRSEGLVDRVLMVSTAGTTSQRSGHKVGVDASYTVEGLAQAAERKAVTLDSRTLVFVDEICIMSSARADHLVNLTSSCYVRTVGDPAQWEAIGNGGWYADVNKQIGHATLRKVYRQRNAEDRQVCLAIRKDRSGEALDNLARRGRLHVEPTHAETVGRLAADYRAHVERGLTPAQTMVLTDTSNAQVDQLNRLLQDIHIDAGHVRGPGVEARDQDAGRTEVFHQGDRVMFQRNWYHDKQGQVRNGAVGEITMVKPDYRAVAVMLDDPDPLGNRRVVTVDLPLYDRQQSLRLAYAGHTAKWQGCEADIVQYLPGNGTTDSHSAYTSLSRGVEEIHVYASVQIHGALPIYTLAERWALHPEQDKATALSRLPEEPIVSVPVPVATLVPEPPRQSRFDQLLEHVGARTSLTNEHHEQPAGGTPPKSPTPPGQPHVQVSRGTERPDQGTEPSRAQQSTVPPSAPQHQPQRTREELLAELNRSPAEQIRQRTEQTQRQTDRTEVISELKRLSLDPRVRAEWQARWQLMRPAEQQDVVEADARRAARGLPPEPAGVLTRRYWDQPMEDRWERCWRDEWSQVQQEQQERAQQQLQDERAQRGDRPRTREEMLADLNRNPADQLRERQQRLAQEQARERGRHW